MSVRYNEAESHYHLYDYRQYLQQQLLLQQSASDWTSFYRMSSCHQEQYFQHSAPMSTSPYLDYCNAVLPTSSWRQLSTNTTSAVQVNGGWHQHPTRSTDNAASMSCSSAVRLSPRSNTPWISSLNSRCDNTPRRVQDSHRLSDVRSAAITAARWHVDDEAASHIYQQDGASFRQHATQVVWPGATVSGTVQHSAVDEFQSSSCSSTHRSHVSSPPTKSTGVVPLRKPRRTKDALVPLIIRAILSAADVRLSLADICRYIEQHSIDYTKSNDEVRWHSNVRHTLSHYEFFVKCGRVPTGRGNYWTIHPVCRTAFAANDFRIKRARHAVQVYEKSVNVTASLRHDRGTYTDQMC